MAGTPALRARVRLTLDTTALKNWDGDLKSARQALKDQVFESGRELAPRIQAEAITTARGVGPQAARAAETSIRVKYNKASTNIVLTSAGVPYAFGAEYGSMRWPQFKPWRGNAENAGYFLWPSVRHQLTIHNEAISKKVDDIMGRPFS